MTEEEKRKRAIRTVATEYASYQSFTGGTQGMWTQTVTFQPTEDYFQCDVLANRYQTYDAEMLINGALAHKVEFKSRNVKDGQYPEFMIEASKIDRILDSGYPAIIVELLPDEGKGYFWFVYTTQGLKKGERWTADYTYSYSNVQGKVKSEFYFLPHAQAMRFRFDPNQFHSDVDTLTKHLEGCDTENGL